MKNAAVLWSLIAGIVLTALVFAAVPLLRGASSPAPFEAGGGSESASTGASSPAVAADSASAASGAAADSASAASGAAADSVSAVSGAAADSASAASGAAADAAPASARAGGSAADASRGDASGGPGEGVEASASDGTRDVSKGGAVARRPNCPELGLAGIDVPCLGGGSAPPDATRVTVINLWAWWCAPCREELPLFAQLAAAHSDYRVVGVHVDPEAAAGAALLSELDVPLPSFQDAKKLVPAHLRLPAVVPITVVTVDGQPVARFPRVFTSLAELEAAVAEAVEGVA